ncbi:MAG: hypothetical protein KatS3mg021_1154 [Fimbriimonadales bacterium]|nr:MAG: hypothetical protein KatS3mg021_1154 [Fimbriimonadales bacterium]
MLYQHDIILIYDGRSSQSGTKTDSGNWIFEDSQRLSGNFMFESRRVNLLCCKDAHIAFLALGVSPRRARRPRPYASLEGRGSRVLFPETRVLCNRAGEPVPKKRSQPPLAILADAGRLRITGSEPQPSGVNAVGFGRLRAFPDSLSGQLFDCLSQSAFHFTPCDGLKHRGHAFPVGVLKIGKGAE